MITGYSGIPYKSKGRSLIGVDCWGLVRLVFSKEADIELPLHTEIDPSEGLKAARALKDALTSETWLEVKYDPLPFDVVLMRNDYRAGGIATHVGIMVFPQILLQTETATGSYLMELSDPSIQCRLDGIYRHRELDQ